MGMTNEEVKALEKIERARRQQSKSRWILLGGGVLVFGCGAYLHVMIRNLLMRAMELPLSTTGTRTIASYLELIVDTKMMVWVGALLIGFAISRWRGSAVEVLLLKLLRDNAERKTS